MHFSIFENTFSSAEPAIHLSTSVEIGKSIDIVMKY